MVKKMLGITTILLLNTLTHSTPYFHAHAAIIKKPKKNTLECSVSKKEPDVETTHSSSKKKLQNLTTPN